MQDASKSSLYLKEALKSQYCRLQESGDPHAEFPGVMSDDPRAEFPGVMSDGQRAESTTEQETGLQRDMTNSKESKRKHEENRNRQRHGEAPTTI